MKRQRTRENLTIAGEETLIAKNENQQNQVESNSLIEDDITENESSIQFLGINTRESSTHFSILPQVRFYFVLK